MLIYREESPPIKWFLPCIAVFLRKENPTNHLFDMSDANSSLPNPIRGICSYTSNRSLADISPAFSPVRAAFWALFCLFFAPVLSHAQATNIRLSGAAKVSIFTIAPGDEVYSVFGHSAIRVQDPAHNLDRVYNYGTFDFDDTFVWKFTRGKLNYRLSVEEYARFDYKYRYFNRSFTEQVLNLDPAQVQAVFDFLESNYLPENRYYLYDFFYDNCATKIPDVINEALQGQIIYDTAPPNKQLSFRDLIDVYCEQGNTLWLDLGIDLALGLPTDKVLNWKEYMFLPDFVLQEFNEAQIKKAGGVIEPLVVAENPIFIAIPEKDSNILPQPSMVFWCIFLIVSIFSIVGFRFNMQLRGLDATLFFLVGLAGCVIIFLWFFTDHTATANNFNLIWALPTHLFASVFLLQKKVPKWLLVYLFSTTAILFFLVVFWVFLPQDLHSAMFPVVLTVGMRSLYIYLRENGWLQIKDFSSYMKLKKE